MAVTIFATAPIVAFAQNDEPADQAPKPTLADAQKVVQTISSDKTKLQAYCELGKLQNQMQKAVQVMLSTDEMKMLDDFRFEHRMPSRAATVRELMRRGWQQERPFGSVGAELAQRVRVDG
jgi:hypothetical protein